MTWEASPISNQYYWIISNFFPTLSIIPSFLSVISNFLLFKSTLLLAKVQVWSTNSTIFFCHLSFLLSNHPHDIRLSFFPNFVHLYLLVKERLPVPRTPLFLVTSRHFCHFKPPRPGILRHPGSSLTPIVAGLILLSMVNVRTIWIY